MFVHQRLTLRHFAAIAFLAFAGAAAPPLAIGGPQHVAPAPPSPALLQKRADQATRQAGAARVLADRANLAAATAAAQLRDAEANFAAQERLVAPRAIVAPLPSQQANLAVAAAQARLQLAQQNAQRAESDANMARLFTPPGGLTGSAAMLASINGQQADAARAAVRAAEQDVASAQRSASITISAGSLAGTIARTGRSDAERIVAVARALAASTARHAAAAETNAQTLAEAADRARRRARAASE